MGDGREKHAIGLSLNEKGVYERIRREIGKGSCRHFANLLIECCDTVIHATEPIFQEQEQRYQKQKQVDIEKVFGNCIKDRGMLIDLHVHTYPASACASSTVEEQIEEELKREVDNRDGFMNATHPFRGFLMFGVDELGLRPEKAAGRKVFDLVDGIEVLNGRVNNNENIFTHEVAKIRGLPETGGSDAHNIDEVG